MLSKMMLHGRLTADPELRFTPSGAAVCNFTIVEQDQRKNEAGAWEDVGEALFLNCSVWRQQAENAAESLAKGDLVLVYGKLKQRSYEDRDGNKRTVVEFECDEVGVSLRFRQIKHGEGRAERGTPVPSEDPWATEYVGSATSSDQPPF